MKKTVIVADDLTGALDVAAPFVAPEVSVQVLLDGCDSTGYENVDVLSVCMETRHLDSVAAGEAVRNAFENTSEDVEVLFKKTDSVLRGNVGAELEALLLASGAQVVHFFPAFPAMGRTTVNGIHLVDGVPVAESSFASDPLNPVTCSRVADIIATTSTVPIIELSAGAPLPADFSGVVIYDAVTQDDINVRMSDILEQTDTLAIAGCAGLSRALAAAQGIRASRSVAGCASDLMVMCGSGNPASRAQCAAAREVAPYATVPRAAMVDPTWFTSANACKFERELPRILDSASPLFLVDASSPVSSDASREFGIGNDELRARISNQLGTLFAHLIRDVRPSAVLVVGGDALVACLRSLGVTNLAPFAEPMPGVVAARVGVDGRNMILATKSGGFGAPGLFSELAEHLSSL